MSRLLLLIVILVASVSVASATSSAAYPDSARGQAAGPGSGDYKTYQLDGSGSWSTTLTLQAGQFIEVTVEQLGTDLAIVAQAPDGLEYVADSPIGSRGIETLSLVANVTGAYKIEIRRLGDATSSKEFRLRIGAPRAATPDDIKRGKAQLEFTTAIKEIQSFSAPPDAETTRRVESALTEASELWTTGGAPIQAASALDQLSALYLHLNRQGDAARVLERGYALVRVVLASDDPRLLSILNGLADCARQARDAKKARGYYEQLTPGVEHVFGPSGRETAGTLAAYGKVLVDLDEAALAIPILERAVKAGELAFGSQHPMMFDACLALGRAYSAQDDPRAIGQFRRAADIAEGLDGPTGERVAIANYALGRADIDLGETADANEPLLKALGILEKTAPPGHPFFGLVWQALGEVAQEAGKYDEAVDYHTKALKRIEEVRGANSAEAAEELSALALAQGSRGQFDDAASLSERAIAAYKAVGLGEAPDVVVVMRQLGDVYAAQGKGPKAIETYRQAQSMAEKIGGPNSPLVAFVLLRLAGTLNDTGYPAEAQSLYDKATSILRTAFGSDAPGLAAVLTQQAKLLIQAGRRAAADPLLNEALTIREKAFGHGDTRTLEVVRDLAENAYLRQDYKEAVRLREWALSEDERRLGADDVGLAESLSAAALALASTSDETRARELYLRAIALVERLSGKASPKLIFPLTGLALLSEDPTENKDLYERILAIQLAGLPADHPALAPNYEGLGQALQRLGDKSSALEAFNKALAIYEKHPDALNENLTLALSNVAIEELELGHLDRAEEAFRRALALRERAFGPTHIEVARSLNSLGGVLLQENRLDEAEQALNRALAIAEATVGKDQPESFFILVNLAGVRMSQGRLDEVLQLNERLVAIRVKQYGPNHPMVAEALKMQAQSFSLKDRYKEAISCYERAAMILRNSSAPHDATYVGLLVDIAEANAQNGTPGWRDLFDAALAASTESTPTDDKTIFRTLIRYGNQEHGAGEYLRAVELFRKAELTAERCFGANTAEVATADQELAEALAAMSDLKGASEAAQKGLAIRESLPNSNPGDLVQSRLEQAELLRLNGRLIDAKAAYDKLVAARSRTMGSGGIPGPAVLSGAAFVYMDLGDYKTARSLIAQEAEEERAYWGDDSDAYAMDLVLLSTIQTAQGDINGAAASARRALALNEQLRGKDHPDTVFFLDGVADVELAAGNIREARDLAARSVAIIEASYGTDRPKLIVPLLTFGMREWALGEFKEALKSTERALRIAETNYGVNSPQVVTPLLRLSEYRRELNDVRAARELLDRARAIQERVFGVESLAVSEVLRHMSSLARVDANFGEAEADLRTALAIRIKLLGLDHPNVAMVQLDLGELLMARDRFDEASTLLQRARTTRVAVYGEAHPLVADVDQSIASLESNRGHFGLAEEAYVRAVRIDVESYGAANPNTATALLNLASFYREQDRFKDAIAKATEALGILESALGKNHVRVASALKTLAEIHRDSGLLREASQTLDRAESIYSSVYPPEHPDIHSLKEDRAGILVLLGFAKAASELLEEVRLSVGRVEGESSGSYARVLSNLAFTRSNEGHFQSAANLLQQALQISERVYGPDHPNTATVIGHLAVAYENLGEFSKAEPLLMRAIASRERVYGKNSGPYADAQAVLGLFEEMRGNYDRQILLTKEAYGTVEELYGAESSLAAKMLRFLGDAYRSSGDYPRAVASYRTSLEVIKRTLGVTHPEYGTALNNLGLVFMEMGDWARAETYFEQARSILDVTTGPQTPDYQTMLNNLALVYSNTGRFAKARDLMARIVKERQASLGPAHPFTALALLNLAYAESRVKDMTLAEIHAKQALEIYEAAFGPRHPMVAQSLLFVAQCEYARSASGDARSSIERAQAILAKANPAGDAAQFAAIQALAIIDWREGHLEDAALRLAETSDGVDRLIARLLIIGSSEQKRLLVETLRPNTNLTLSLLFTGEPSATATRLALTTELRRKGRALDAALEGVSDLRAKLSPDDRAVLDQLREASSRLSNLALERATLGGTTESDLKSAAAEVDHLEALFSERTGAVRAGEALVTIESVQSRLPVDAALIEIAQYERIAPDTLNPKAAPGSGRYAAFVLRANGPPVAVDLGPSASIEESIRAFRDALRTPQSGNIRDRARALDALVMAPLRGAIGDAKQLVISPDGDLNLVPFAALVDDEGRYLAERYVSSYVTSGRELLRIEGTDAETQTALIVGNPDFASTQNVASETRGLVGGEAERDARLVFTPLPGTMSEVTSISGLMPDARVLTGAEATESALKSVNRPSILHVATHGFFVGTTQSTGPGTRGISFVATEEEAPTAMVPDPLLRSGIALAGANGGSTNGEDGILTALEAARLDLVGTKLVVLSACDTGVGEVRSGDGVYGLRRALVLAGSRAQVMSLWPVSDKATRDLMVNFYTGLLGGAGRADALRTVQLKMLADPTFSHPYYWASFIVSGDWRPLATPPKN